jgi:hypothetical protein
MRDVGITPVPSTAALARIFCDANVARAEPRKKPRASYRRFVYPAPNACWQLDATDYVLTGGRTCVIFQLIDDHPRYAVASFPGRPAPGETGRAAGRRREMHAQLSRERQAAHGPPPRTLVRGPSVVAPPSVAVRAKPTVLHTAPRPRFPSAYLHRRVTANGSAVAHVTVLGRASLYSLALIAAGFCEPPDASRGAERPRSGAAGALDASGGERIIAGRGQRERT